LVKTILFFFYSEVTEDHCMYCCVFVQYPVPQENQLQRLTSNHGFYTIQLHLHCDISIFYSSISQWLYSYTLLLAPVAQEFHSDCTMTV